MSEYQHKSQEYEKAANYLGAQGISSAVAHPAYYSCFLLLLHIVTYSGSFDINDIDLRDSINTGSHVNTINIIHKFIHQYSKKDSGHFRSNMGELKRLRTSADYSEDPFMMTDASRSITLMKYTLSILAKYFV